MSGESPKYLVVAPNLREACNYAETLGLDRTQWRYITDENQLRGYRFVKVVFSERAHLIKNYRAIVKYVGYMELAGDLAK